jgi:hypothetical protein
MATHKPTGERTTVCRIPDFSAARAPGFVFFFAYIRGGPSRRCLFLGAPTPESPRGSTRVQVGRWETVPSFSTGHRVAARSDLDTRATLTTGRVGALAVVCSCRGCGFCLFSSRQPVGPLSFFTSAADNDVLARGRRAVRRPRRQRGLCATCAACGGARTMRGAARPARRGGGPPTARRAVPRIAPCASAGAGARRARPQGRAAGAAGMPWPGAEGAFEVPEHRSHTRVCVATRTCGHGEAGRRRSCSMPPCL